MCIRDRAEALVLHQFLLGLGGFGRFERRLVDVVKGALLAPYGEDHIIPLALELHVLDLSLIHISSVTASPERRRW